MSLLLIFTKAFTLITLQIRLKPKYIFGHSNTNYIHLDEAYSGGCRQEILPQLRSYKLRKFQTISDCKQKKYTEEKLKALEQMVAQVRNESKQERF